MRSSATLTGRLLTSRIALKASVWLFATALFLVLASSAKAATWDYSINTFDTPTSVDISVTNADMDIDNNEIRLPRLKTPDLISFWGSGEMDYVVLTGEGVKHYSFNGSNMVENTILNVSGLTNPLALAAPDPYPDVLVAEPSGVKRYSFTGSAMIHNPILSAAGLEGVTAVGAAGAGEIAVLKEGQVEHYSFSGVAMARNTMLEPAVELNNPIDVALGSGGYDLAVLESERVRWFNFSGVGLVENPLLSITGLSAPKAFAVADPNFGYDVAVVDGTEVKHFSFSGSSLAYNVSLSVTSGLAAPRAVAIRPGSFDRIIIDGNQVRYYQWNGSSLNFNPNLSVTVANIVNGEGYSATAVVQSLAFDPGSDTAFVRVRAVHELPDGTSVTWSVTAGGSWVKKWRVRGTGSGSVCEVTPDNGTTWSTVGDAGASAPENSNPQLWAQVAPGRAVKWKAELVTADARVTPKIATNPRGGVAVKLDTNSPPKPPTLPTFSSCFATTTPALSWTFEDPDDDTQSAYQVRIIRESDMAVILDTGKIDSGLQFYEIPAGIEPDVPGVLWESGAYQFKYRVKVWDQVELESDWSNYSDFCVVAFERPRVTEIISPPPGQDSPDPLDPTTHIVITTGMTLEYLPKTKAGAKVVLLVDSVGPVDTFSSSFPYLGETASTNLPSTLPDGLSANPLYSAGSSRNRWCVEFWTNSSLEICPSGTVVQMNLTGSSSEGAKLLTHRPTLKKWW